MLQLCQEILITWIFFLFESGKDSFSAEKFFIDVIS